MREEGCCWAGGGLAAAVAAVGRVAGAAAAAMGLLFLLLALVLIALLVFTLGVLATEAAVPVTKGPLLLAAVVGAAGGGALGTAAVAVAAVPCNLPKSAAGLATTRGAAMDDGGFLSMLVLAVAAAVAIEAAGG